MTQLSKNRIKYIRSLELKKHRNADGVFIAEGPKLIEDLLGKFDCTFIAGTTSWIKEHPGIKAGEIIEVTQDELSRISLLKAPQQVLGIFKQPDYSFSTDVLKNELCIGLDDVQDPGNLGTIIRLADWFGIENIFCSQGTADAFNPKTIQATMGAIARVKIHYTPLKELIGKADKINVYGTFLEGENIYNEKLANNGLLIMGNEGKGISKELEQLITKKLYIPNYPMDRGTSESLNVAVATAIACAEFRRQASC